MVRRLKTIKLLLLALLPLLCSCGEEYCEESGSGLPLVGVYAMTTPPVQAKIDSITIYGVGQLNDSILYNNVSGISSFYTPLDVTRNIVKYVLLYESKLVPEQFKRDTLTYYYNKELVFETHECGATYKFKIVKFEYTTNSIVYAKLITPDVDNLTSQTVKIYYAEKK